MDDEPQIRRVMRATLSAHGYTIVEARDGQEALEKLRSERADLVILDMNMPVMDGLEACREIRAGFSVPIIMLTVRNAEKDKVPRSTPAPTTTSSSPSAFRNSSREFAPRCAAPPERRRGRCRLQGVGTGFRKAHGHRARQGRAPDPQGV